MQNRDVIANSEEIELLLVIRVGGGRSGVLFPPGAENAFCVGSDPSADLNLASSEVRPIEFFWERQGPYLMLRPGSRGRQLKLNRAEIASQVVMPEFARIEFGDCVLHCRLFGRIAPDPQPRERVRFRHVEEAQLPPEPPLHSTVCLRSDAERKGTDATVRVAVPAQARSAAANGSERALGEVTADIPIDALSAVRTVAQTTTHVRVVQAGDYLPTSVVPTVTLEQPEVLARAEANETIELSSVDAALIEAEAIRPDDACNLRARLPLSPLAQASQLRATPATDRGIGGDAAATPGPRALPSGGRIDQSPVAGHGRRELSTLGGLGDVASEPPEHPPTPRQQPVSPMANKPDTQLNRGDAPGAPRWQAPTTECSAVDWAAIPKSKKTRAASENTALSRRSGPLKQLGEWTRRRPVLVFGLALGLGLTAATVAVLLFRARRPTPNVAVVAASGRRQAQDPPKALPNAGLAKSAVADLAVPARTGQSSSSNASESSRLIHTGALGSSRELRALAAEHLAAGRHSDALRVFEQLQAQSGEKPTGKAIVRILKLRLSSDCDVRGQDVSKAKYCPEILP